ncbi:TonB-dependent receptor [Steroidobacter sp. S1-65]|uniref:TonB-dependent receptor n=1 Tax=Steroidobacter gossypii TaxID=2805490 RepID=A0ABS1WSP3_9GAMM|nr:TonB-dependent receptor [Steroidobacter gossypii]MBM0103979.1 TonB-dependent receptor [Steroidobacter gossypii]
MAKRIGVHSASALAALSLSVSAVAQQTSTQSVELEEVVVTGVRQSLVQGLENKREATQVVESIVAEDIGKLPDNNVVEALQRIAGIQITDRGGGEADGIVIRGLDDVQTTWNGRNVFTASPPPESGRQLALQDIPANLISRVDVYKTRAADQLETGLAGQIDVTTRRPFDFPGFEMSLNARATTQEQRDDIDPNASVLLANTWDVGGGRFGVMLNGSYSRVRYRDQSITAGALLPFLHEDAQPNGLGVDNDSCLDPPAGNPYNPNWVPLERIFNGDCRLQRPGEDAPQFWQPGTDRGLSTTPGSTITMNGVPYEYLLARDALFAVDLEGDRERPAGTLALQWAPNDSSEYTFEAFYQGYREEWFNNLHFTFVDFWGALGPDPGSTYELFPGTNIIKSRTVGDIYGFQSGDVTEQETDTFVYALNGKWQIGERLSLNADLSLQDSQFDTNFFAVRTDRVAASATVDFNAGNGLPSWQFNDNSLLNQASSWNLAQLYQNKGRQEGAAQTLQIDGDYQLGDGLFRQLSFGVRYDDRQAEAYAPKAQLEINLQRSMTILPSAATYVNSGFFDGEANVPSSWMSVNGYYAADHKDEFRALYGMPLGDPALIRTFEVKERTASAYVQTDMEIGKLQGQFGLRYVSVDTPMQFTDLITDRSSTAKQSVSDVLPSLTLRYALTDDLMVRFNYGETLRRPAFFDLNSNYSLVGDLTGLGYGRGNGGNPDLKPATAKNYDLTAEWYFAPDSALYATLFRREIDGLVVPLTRFITIENSGLNTDLFVVTQPVNASDGLLEGIELGFVYFPEYLPGFLRGLGATGSFTKLNSEQNIPMTDSEGNIIGEETSEFFGVSDMSYNLTLAYDRAGVGVRLSYVWRDDFLNNNEQRQFANPIGIWRSPEESLDLQVSYNITDKLAVSFDAVNLTEEMQQSYYKFGDAGGPTTHNFGNTLLSRSFALGVRWRL